MKPTHGVSVFDNPENVKKKGFIPHEIDESTVPPTLKVEQRCDDKHHFEIMPKEENLTSKEFADECGKIKTEPKTSGIDHKPHT